jgi:hypothetical protein
MDAKEQDALLVKAKSWFRDTILPNHLKNTEKLKKVELFDVNPFLAPYLAV